MKGPGCVVRCLALHPNISLGRRAELTVLASGTESVTWLFVIRRGQLHTMPKIRGVSQHSSVWAGAPVDAAGLFDFERSTQDASRLRLQRLEMSSGHYKPGSEALVTTLGVLAAFLMELPAKVVTDSPNAAFEVVCHDVWKDPPDQTIDVWTGFADPPGVWISNTFTMKVAKLRELFAEGLPSLTTFVAQKCEQDETTIEVDAIVDWRWLADAAPVKLQWCRGTSSERDLPACWRDVVRACLPSTSTYWHPCLPHAQHPVHDLFSRQNRRLNDGPLC